MLILLCGAALCAPAYSAAPQDPLVTLEDCLTAVQKEGPQARLSRLNLAIGEQQYADARARNGFGMSATSGVTHTVSSLGSDALAPSNDLQAGVEITGPLSTRLGVAGSQGLDTVPLSTDQSDITLSVSATLWDGYPGGQGRGAVQQAQIALQGQQAAAQSDQRTLDFEVKQAYYGVLAAQRQIEVFTDALSQRGRDRERIQDQIEQGDATPIDLLQAQVNERTAELDLRRAQSLLEIAREKLSALVGWPLRRIYTVAEIPDAPLPDVDVDQAIERALAQRVDLKKYELDRSSSRIELDLANSQRSPIVSASGSYSPNRDLNLGSDAADWSIGLQVRIPVFDSGSISAQVRQAELQGEALKVQESQLAASIAIQVRGALFELKDRIDLAALAARNLELVEGRYELASIQHESGMISTLDLLEASVKRTTAAADLAKSRSDVQLAALALQAALGE